jgi:hypothetical protein
VAGNYSAVTLAGKLERDAKQTKAMLAAAVTGLKYWKLADTWLEEERAEHRLAQGQMQAGKSREAVTSAQRCIPLSCRNTAPAIEQVVQAIRDAQTIEVEKRGPIAARAAQG